MDLTLWTWNPDGTTGTPVRVTDVLLSLVWALFAVRTAAAPA